jgi:hypothetical protein
MQSREISTCLVAFLPAQRAVFAAFPVPAFALLVASGAPLADVAAVPAWLRIFRGTSDAACTHLFLSC